MSDNNIDSDNNNESINFIDSIENVFKNMDYKDVIYFICLIILAGVVIILPTRIRHNGYDILRIFRTLGVRILIFVGIITSGFYYNLVITSIISILCLLLMWISYGIGDNEMTHNIINTSEKFKQLMDILIENNENNNQNQNNNNNSDNSNNININNIDINNNDNKDNKSIIDILPISSNKKNKIKSISKKINRLSNVMYSDDENDNFNKNRNSFILDEKQPLLSNGLFTSFASLSNDKNKNINDYSPNNESFNSSNNFNNNINDVKEILKNNNKLKHKLFNNIDEDNENISLNVSKKISDYNKINHKCQSMLINNEKNRKKILNKLKKFGINNNNHNIDDFYNDNYDFDDKKENLPPTLSDNDILTTSSSDNEKDNDKIFNLRKSDTFDNELSPDFMKLIIDECNKNNNSKLLEFIEKYNKKNK